MVGAYFQYISPSLCELSFSSGATHTGLLLSGICLIPLISPSLLSPTSFTSFSLHLNSFFFKPDSKSILPDRHRTLSFRRPLFFPSSFPWLEFWFPFFYQHSTSSLMLTACSWVVVDSGNRSAFFFVWLRKFSFMAFRLLSFLSPPLCRG